MSKLFFRALLIAAVALSVLSGAVLADKSYPRWATNAPAIGGYDATAYFNHGTARRGDNFVVAWNGASWRFASAGEAAAFKANPTAYQPQFGAYCTGGLSQGHVVNGNPEIWRLHDGKLYMFYARAGAKRFDKDPAGTIAAAARNATKFGIVKE